MEEKDRPGDSAKSFNGGKGKENSSPGKKDRNDSLRMKKLESLKKWIRSAPDIRYDKVELIKRKIKNGTYEVKSEKIAEKIIESEDLF